MHYARFRQLGMFVGSGAVEAGCKAIIGQRLKLSGMHWSVPGATAIATLRCQEASGRWERDLAAATQPDSHRHPSHLQARTHSDRHRLTQLPTKLAHTRAGRVCDTNVGDVGRSS